MTWPGRIAAFLPFQELALYPLLVVAGGAQGVFGTLAVECGGEREEEEG